MLRMRWQKSGEHYNKALAAAINRKPDPAKLAALNTRCSLPSGCY